MADDGHASLVFRMTPFADDAAIEAIASAFLSRTLLKAQWTHAAHFAPNASIPRVIHRSSSGEATS
jgi:hypothetical protein